MFWAEESTYEVPHAAVKLNDVDLVRSAQLPNRRNKELVDPPLDPTGCMPVAVVGRVELVQGVHTVVEAVENPHGDALAVREGDLAPVHETPLVPAFKLRTMSAREVGRVRARRVPRDVAVHRYGDVAAEELAELDEAVPVDRVADDEDGRRTCALLP